MELPTYQGSTPTKSALTEGLCVLRSSETVLWKRGRGTEGEVSDRLFRRNEAQSGSPAERKELAPVWVQDVGNAGCVPSPSTYHKSLQSTHKVWYGFKKSFSQSWTKCMLYVYEIVKGQTRYKLKIFKALFLYFSCLHHCSFFVVFIWYSSIHKLVAKMVLSAWVTRHAVPSSAESRNQKPSWGSRV